MKSYRVTDDFKIVRYGNRLRFELWSGESKCVIDDISDDDVAQMIDALIDIEHERIEVPLTMVMRRESPSSVEMALKFTNSEDVTIALKDYDKDCTVGVCLNEHWKIVKLEEILTSVISKLCEEGI